MSPENWKLTGKFLIHDGYRIFYRTWGDPRTKPLLLLHGYPSSSWDFYKIADELGKYFHIIALDFLGLGFSEKPKDADYFIATQADIVEAVLSRLNINTYHILAHDYGDTVAQELLARDLSSKEQQARVQSVCFLNGGLFPETHHPLLIQKLLTGPLGGSISRWGNKYRFKQTLKKVFGKHTPPSHYEIDKLWEILNYNKGKLQLHKLMSYIKQRQKNRTRWVSCLNMHTAPKAIINGSSDPISGRHMVDRYRHVVENKGFICELSDIGHYPHLEDPEAVLNAYFKFISEFIGTRQRISQALHQATFSENLGTQL